MTEPWWSDGTVTIWHGNALDLPLPDESVDLIVTSPPYFGLRSYTDGGEHYDGQIGSEATPAEFLDALIAATREMVRVLKPTGSIFVNLGDKYAVRWASVRDEGRAGLGGPSAGRRRAGANNSGVPEKSLMLLPERYRIRAVDELGLIARAVLVWSKPNGLPESVTDRVRRSHEDWVHLTKRPRYYAAVDEIREEHLTPGGMGWAANGRGRKITSDNGRGHNVDSKRGEGLHAMGGNPLGKLPGSVWEIPTQPLQVPAELGVDHFAAYPLAWPLRLIRGWSPSGYCTACDQPRTPTTDKQLVGGSPFAGRDYRRLANGPTGGPERPMPGGSNVVTVTGYVCACPSPDAPTRPAVVLDPFAGTGTTGLAARALGRRAHLVDLSADYCRLARWRVTDPGELARALDVPKPPPVPEGVDALFDLDGEAS